MELLHRDRSSHRKNLSLSGGGVTCNSPREADEPTSKQLEDRESSDLQLQGDSKVITLVDSVHLNQVQSSDIHPGNVQVNSKLSLDKVLAQISSAPQGNNSKMDPTTEDDYERWDCSGVAAKFVNRPDGTPLATIVERNSCSTLDSKASSLPNHWRFARKVIKPIYEGSTESAAPTNEYRKDQSLVEDHVTHQASKAIIDRPTVTNKSEANIGVDTVPYRLAGTGHDLLHSACSTGSIREEFYNKHEATTAQNFARHLQTLFTNIMPLHDSKQCLKPQIANIKELRVANEMPPEEVEKAYWQVVCGPRKLICELKTSSKEVERPHTQENKRLEKQQVPPHGNDIVAPASKPETVTRKCEMDVGFINPVLSPQPSKLMVDTARSPMHSKPWSLLSSTTVLPLSLDRTHHSYAPPLCVVSSDLCSKTPRPFLSLSPELSQKPMPNNWPGRTEDFRVDGESHPFPVYSDAKRANSNASSTSSSVRRESHAARRSSKVICATAEVHSYPSIGLQASSDFRLYGAASAVTRAPLNTSKRFILNPHSIANSGVSTSSPSLTTTFGERVVRLHSAALPVLLPIAAAEGIVRPIVPRCAPPSNVSRRPKKKICQSSTLASSSTDAFGDSRTDAIRPRLHGLSRVQAGGQASRKSTFKKDSLSQSRLKEVAAGCMASVNDSNLKEGQRTDPLGMTSQQYGLCMDGTNDPLKQLEPIPTEAPIPRTDRDDSDGKRRRLRRFVRACFCQPRNSVEGDTGPIVDPIQSSNRPTLRRCGSAP